MFQGSSDEYWRRKNSREESLGCPKIGQCDGRMAPRPIVDWPARPPKGAGEGGARQPQGDY